MTHQFDSLLARHCLLATSTSSLVHDVQAGAVMSCCHVLLIALHCSCSVHTASIHTCLAVCPAVHLGHWAAAGPPLSQCSSWAAWINRSRWPLRKFRPWSRYYWA